MGFRAIYLMCALAVAANAFGQQVMQTPKVQKIQPAPAAQLAPQDQPASAATVPPQGQPAQAIDPPSTACADSCCGSCQPSCGLDSCGCCRCSCDGRVVGGAEIVFAKPYLHNNFAFDHVVPGSQVEATPFDFDFQTTPRVWLGYVNGSGFGGRVRYWSFDEARTAAAQANGANDFYLLPEDVGAGLPFQRVSVTNRIQAYTLDGEVMQQVCSEAWTANFGGGLRGVSLNQDGLADWITVGGAPGSGFANNHFNGVGPTVFAELKRSFGCCGFALIGNVRGSYACGDRVLEKKVPATGNLDRIWRAGDGLAIGEIQLGLEWSREMCCGGHFSVQGMWEEQFWTGASNVVRTADDLALMGFSVGIGITR